jgi:ribosome hibernation promoting factor
MKLIVTGRQVTVTDAIRQDIERRLARLSRLLNDSAVSAQCAIGRERGRFVCDLTVHARGDHMLHGVGKHAVLTTALGAAVEKVTQQALKLADRWKTRRKNGAGARVPAAEPAVAAGAPEPGGIRVIRARTTPVRPMSIDDAVLALSTGDRTFFVFRHDASNAVAVLYRRPDGHFGLIEPEA